MQSMRKSIAILMLLTACTSAPGTEAQETIYSTPPYQDPGNELTCAALDHAPAPDPDEPSLFPAVQEGDHAFGANDPAVTFIEYGDFQCPSCAQLAPILLQLVLQYPEDVRVVFRQLPLLDIHDKALLAAQASEAAARQDKFWDMHDILYGHQNEWAALTAIEFENWLLDRAAVIGLNLGTFEIDLKDPLIIEHVQGDLVDALNIGLRATPFLLLNGQIQQPPYNYELFDQTIRLILLSERQFTTCPPLIIDPQKQYTATLHTEKGDIVIGLFTDAAPITVNNFIYLSQQGWYEDITFYRVIPDSVAQTGDPSETGIGNPGYYFIDEINPYMTFDRPGLVAMYNVGPDTNGSQFFITYGPLPQLNGQYTIFGEVISGMDVLAKLTPRDPTPGSILAPGDRLLTVTIAEE